MSDYIGDQESFCVQNIEKDILIAEINFLKRKIRTMNEKFENEIESKTKVIVKMQVIIDSKMLDIEASK